MNDELQLKNHLTFDPSVENGHLPEGPFGAVLACGMGGSALPMRLTASLKTRIPVVLHDSFGLPLHVPNDPLCVAISYSGETQETLSFAKEALERGLPLVVITTGGTLAAFAEENKLPLVRFSHENRPARDMVLPMLRSLLYVCGESELLAECAKINPDVLQDSEDEGRRLSGMNTGAIPVIYASHAYSAVAYIWKIMLNETAGMPAFASIVPEAFHNELEGFGPKKDGDEGETSVSFHALCIQDEDPVLQARFDVFVKLVRERGITVETLELKGESAIERLVYGWLVARAASRALAEVAGIDPHETPLINEFKKRI